MTGRSRIRNADLRSMFPHLKGELQTNRNDRRTVGCAQWSNLIESAAPSECDAEMSRKCLKCIRAKGHPAEK
jgi:hypothetical protein